MPDIGDLTAADEALTGSDEIVVHNVSKADGSKDQRATLAKVLADALEYLESTYTPAITGSSSNPTLTYTTQLGYYTRIGNIVFFEADIVLNTYSGGSGNVRISLPFSAASGRRPLMNAFVVGVNWGSSATQLAFYIGNSVAYGELRGLINNGTPTTVAVGDLAAGDIIRVAGWYVV